MPKPPRDALRREILTVAQRLFSTLGFQATSLQMIADEVSCSKAAVLYHFKTKTAILDAPIAGLNDELDEILGALVAPPESDRMARVSFLGDNAWWLPRRLDRALPNVDIEGESLRTREPAAVAASKQAETVR